MSVDVAPEFIVAHCSAVNDELFNAYSNAQLAGVVAVVYLYILYTLFQALSVPTTNA